MVQKAAIIGAGAIAREHLACLKNLPGVELAGVCDLSPVMAEATAEEFGCKAWYTDHRALLGEAKPDVVHVTTPPHTHFALAKDALEAGAHVLVEKPITHEPAELALLLDLGRERGRIVVEDHNYMYNRPVQEILRRIKDGSFGRVTHVEVSIALAITGKGSRYTDPNLPHPCLKLPGGAIADFLTHLAYLAYVFVGPHRAVRTAWRKLDQGSPLPSDEFRALVDAERGTAFLSFSAHGQPDAFTLRVQGTRMRAQASLFDPLLAIERLRGGPRPLQPVANGLSSALSFGRGGVGGLVRKLSGKPMSYEGLHELIARLYRAAERGPASDGKPGNTGERGAEGPVSRKQMEAVQRLVLDLTREELAL